jgi:predicted O-methyltransferase YrrM
MVDMLIFHKIFSRLHVLMERGHRKRTQQVLSQRLDTSVALAKLSDGRESDVENFLDEFDSVVSGVRTAMELPGTADMTLISVLYSLIRLRRPAKVVETGVWHGVSSFVILRALRASGGGSLCSVDIPPLNPKNRVVVGGFVPDELRDSWDLQIGPATKLLPQIACNAMANGGFDMFVHDSDHNYFNMMKEFRIAWPALKSAGLLVADDAHTNDAVLDFADEVRREVIFIARQKGGAIAVLVK